MQLKLLLFFTIYPVSLLSQVNISGTVFDKETQKPVANVVIYTDKEMTMTDAAGNYKIEAKPSEKVYFRQLAYHFFDTLSDSLSRNGNVYLMCNVNELNELVVTSLDLHTIVQKAKENSRKRLEQKKVRPYLFHLEGSTDTGEEREVYALANVFLEEISSIIGCKWNINVIQWDKIKQANKRLFYYKIFPLGLELFPRKFPRTSRSDFHYELLGQDDKYFIIRKYSKKNMTWSDHSCYYYTISKQDTVLIETVLQSLPNVSEKAFRKMGKNSVRIINHFAKTNYVSDNETGAYYIQKSQHILSVDVMEKNEQRNVISKVTISVLNDIPNIGNKTRAKIRPYDIKFYEIDIPESPGFWKQFSNP